MIVASCGYDAYDDDDQVINNVNNDATKLKVKKESKFQVKRLTKQNLE